VYALKSFITFSGRQSASTCCVDVMGSDVRREEVPTPMRTDFMKGFEYRGPAVLVKEIRRLAHLPEFRGGPLRIGFRQLASGQIVVPVDRPWFAVQVRSVTLEGDEIAHGSGTGSLTVAVRYLL